jgi:hypothetical protein
MIHMWVHKLIVGEVHDFARYATSAYWIQSSLGYMMY